MNHHPPSPVGRALTVVLGAVPFTVILIGLGISLLVALWRDTHDPSQPDS